MVHENLHTQYRHYELELWAVRARRNAIITGIMLVLNFIDGNPALPLVGDQDIQPLLPNPFVERCKAALVNFRTYVQSIACAVAGHALVVVRSVYPMASLEVIDGGFAKVMEDTEAEQLTKEATESAFRLFEDMGIFSDKEQ